jgi:alpha-L-arabinofuranosidase
MNVVINPAQTAGEVSPLWFGHNLEHTRSCVWQGLSAQLLRNRKFAGMPQTSGVALDWYPIGAGQTWYLLELAPSKWDPGTTGETYTHHFDPLQDSSRAHALERQRIQSFDGAAPAGIGQNGLPLVGGKAYAGRVALQAETALQVKVTVYGDAGRAVWHETTVQVAPGAWHEFSFGFTAPQSDGDARIEITFAGAGVLCVGAVSLLPPGQFRGMRTDVVELLKQIATPLLRWPGGNFADNYFWKDGLLPVDQRAPLRSHFHETLPHTHDYDTHEIGTDEYIALCREIGAEPFITINLGTEGPAEAAAWVEYCNGSTDTRWGRLRAERGHAEPYNVKYWSLGNEYGYGHMLGPNDPQGYRRVVTECATRMRAVDPSLVFTVCGIWWDEAWHNEVLEKIGDCFDIVSFHDYTRLMKDYTGPAVKDEFRRVTSEAPAAVFEQVGKVRGLIDNHAPGGKHIGISFDEWNVWYAWYRSPGIIEGLFTATMLNHFVREARKLGITLGAFFEPINEGALWVRPDGAGLTAMGQAFSLLKAHYGRQLITLAPQEATAALDIAATVDAAGREVVVSLVNRSPDENCVVRLDLTRVIKNCAGTLLAASNYLPGSVFDETPFSATIDGAEATLMLPQHCIALLRITL